MLEIYCDRSEEPTLVTLDQFASFEGSLIVEDVNRLDSRREGKGVWLEALLREVGINPAEYQTVTMCSEEVGFEVWLPLKSVLKDGVIIFERQGKRLTTEQGGPLRLIIPETVTCGQNDVKTGQLDNCANVKHLKRMTLQSEIANTVLT